MISLQVLVLIFKIRYTTAVRKISMSTQSSLEYGIHVGEGTHANSYRSTMIVDVEQMKYKKELLFYPRMG
jgi:hypothetical protein